MRVKRWNGRGGSGINAFYTVWRSRGGSWALELHGSVLLALLALLTLALVVQFFAS